MNKASLMANITLASIGALFCCTNSVTCIFVISTLHAPFDFNCLCVVVLGRAEMLR